MLRRRVEATGRPTHELRPRRDLEDTPTSPRRVLIAHKAHRLLQHMCRAPEIDLEQRAGDVVWSALDLAQERCPSVADDHIDPAERALRSLERVEDILMDGDVYFEEKETLFGVLRCEVVEDFWPAECRYYDVAFREDVAGDVKAEPR